MPSALLRTRPWSLILAWGLPLYAVSGCELFLGTVEDPKGSAADGGLRDGDGSSRGGGGSSGSGGASSAGGGASSGGVSSETGGAPAGGEDGRGDASAGGGAIVGGGTGTGGLRGSGTGGAFGSGGSGTGGRGSGGANAAGGAVATGGAIGNGGAINSGGTASSGGAVSSGGAIGSGGAVSSGGTNATGGGTAAGGAAGCCDCDGDLQPAATPRCGGTDCDDDDADVFTGQNNYFLVPSKHRGFDYNCVNGAERDPNDLATVDCKTVLGVGCAQGAGYFSSNMTEPVCGASGAWGTCAKPALMCVENKIEDRIMGCH